MKSNRSISSVPAKMNAGPQHERAEDAPEQDPELVRRGTAKKLKITAHTKTLSIDSDFSIRNPERYPSAALPWSPSTPSR